MTPSKTEHELEELLRATAETLEGMARGFEEKDADERPESFGPGLHPITELLSNDLRGKARRLREAADALPALLAERKRLREELSALAAAVEAIPGGAIATTPARVLLGQRAVDYEQDLIDAANAEARSLLAEQEATDER